MKNSKFSFKKQQSEHSLEKSKKILENIKCYFEIIPKIS